jgi:hypothetical protein
MSGAEQAKHVNGISEVFVRVSAGDTVFFPSNNVQKCGNVLAVGNSLNDADFAASLALGQFQIRLRPLVQVTTDYLLRGACQECFAGLPEKLRMQILSMPAVCGDPSLVDLDATLAVQTLTGWEQRGARDWHGIEFTESVRLACERGRGALASPGERRFQLAGLFWKALLRGGHQGAVYMMDSVREARRRGGLKEFLASQ